MDRVINVNTQWAVDALHYILARIQSRKLLCISSIMQQVVRERLYVCVCVCTTDVQTMSTTFSSSPLNHNYAYVFFYRRFLPTNKEAKPNPIPLIFFFLIATGRKGVAGKMNVAISNHVETPYKYGGQPIDQLN